MEKMDLILKGAVGFAGTVVSFLVGGLGLAFTILLGLMLLDYITGLMVAVASKKVSSEIGIKGFIRKLYVILLIGAIYMISQVIDGLNYIGDGVTIAYIVIEFISITENGGKLGAPMPRAVQEIIETLKGESGNAKNNHK